MTANADAGDAKRPAPSKWREIWDLFGCIAVAVVIALLVKRLLLEPFVIPSASMEPTLQGRVDGGDRVLCTKWSYDFLGHERREPQRWEIIVFKYPADHPEFRGQSFIKRCIGLPGERILLRGGDVWATSRPGQKPTLQAKPDRIQRDLWIAVYEENFDSLALAELAHFWHIRPGVEIADGVLRLAPNAAMEYRPRVRAGNGMAELSFVPDRYVLRQTADFVCTCGAQDNSCPSPRPDAVRGRFRRTIWNQKIAGRCPHCGAYLLEDRVVHYGRRSDLPGEITPNAFYRQGEADKMRKDAYHPVKDLRVVARCCLTAGANLRLTLQAEPRESIAAVFQAGSPGTLTLYLDNRELPEQRREIPLPAGEWLTLEMYRADGMARIFINGDKGLRWEHEIPLVIAAAGSQSPPRNTGVRLEALDDTVSIDDLRIDRDIHYYGRYSDDEDAYNVKSDQFMALGDNCPASNDSRNWGMVPRQNLSGPAVLVWWPPQRVRWLPQP